jgi:hypothetical protein
MESEFKDIGSIKVGKEPAVYKIRIAEVEGIKRFLDFDQQSVLYIGKSKKCVNRIKAFNRSADEIKSGHEAGLRLLWLRILHPSFSRISSRFK